MESNIPEHEKLLPEKKGPVAIAYELQQKRTAEQIENTASCVLILICGLEVLYAIALYVLESQSQTTQHTRFVSLTHIVEIYENSLDNVTKIPNFPHSHTGIKAYVQGSKQKKTTYQLQHNDRSRQTMTRRKTRCVTKWLNASCW